MFPRRAAAVAAVAVAAGLVLTSCSAAGNSPSTDGKPVTVTAMTIGYPDQDSTDAKTGAKVPGIQTLETEFNKAHKDVQLKIVNIPWGEGSTGYQPKTEAMIQANQACVYEMPGAEDYGRRGYLLDLDTMIKKDPSFKNVWGDQIDVAKASSPTGNLWYIPDNTGERVVNWDSQIFKDYGVAPLSKNPTLNEIATKAKELTGTDPVTGQQTYGYWYQGKYAVWQFLNIGHAMGATWGKTNKDGSMTINWDTPTYEKALQWFVDMSKLAPKGALSSDQMPDGFLTDQNVVGIIPEGEAGYYLQPFVADPTLADRFRTSYDIKGKDGLGGLNSITPMTISKDCKTPDAAWTALQWLAGSNQAEKYYYDSLGRLPVTKSGAEAVPEVGKLKDGDVILNQPLTAEAMYPWASQDPRYDLQAALEAALAGTMTPKQALEQAQSQTKTWLSNQGLTQ